jgi:hypothetical protein
MAWGWEKVWGTVSERETAWVTGSVSERETALV